MFPDVTLWYQWPLLALASVVTAVLDLLVIRFVFPDSHHDLIVTMDTSDWPITAWRWSMVKLGYYPVMFVGWMMGLGMAVLLGLFFNKIFEIIPMAFWIMPFWGSILGFILVDLFPGIALMFVFPFNKKYRLNDLLDIFYISCIMTPLFIFAPLALQREDDIQYLEKYTGSRLDNARAMGKKVNVNELGEEKRKKTSIKTLVRDMRSPEAKMRKEAAEELSQILNENGDISTASGEVENLCREALHDPVEIVRYVAAELLGRMKSTAASSDLAKLLSDVVPSVRVAAADALGLIGDPRAQRIAMACDDLKKGKVKAVREMLAALAEECAWIAGNGVPGLKYELGSISLPTSCFCLPIALHFCGLTDKADLLLRELIDVTNESKFLNNPVAPRCEWLVHTAMSNAFVGTNDKVGGLLCETVRLSDNEQNAGSRTGLLLMAARAARRCGLNDLVDEILGKAREVAVSASRTGISFHGRTDSHHAGSELHRDVAERWAEQLLRLVEKVEKEINVMKAGVKSTFEDYAKMIGMRDFIESLKRGPIHALEALETVKHAYGRLVGIILVERMLIETLDCSAGSETPEISIKI